MTKGNLEYSSLIVSMYLFFVLEGSGPLKSRLNLSKGCVERLLLEEEPWLIFCTYLTRVRNSFYVFNRIWQVPDYMGHFCDIRVAQFFV